MNETMDISSMMFSSIDPSVRTLLPSMGTLFFMGIVFMILYVVGLLVIPKINYVLGEIAASIDPKTFYLMFISGSAEAQREDPFVYGGDESEASQLR